MVYQVGDLILNDQTWGVKKGEKEINLTRREFRVLKMLMQNEGDIVERKTLEKECFVKKPKSNVVASTITYIRNKIPGIKIEPFIGVGWKIIK